MRRLLLAIALIAGVVAARQVAAPDGASKVVEYADGTWMIGTRPGVSPADVAASAGVSAAVVGVSGDYFLVRTTGDVVARLASRSDVLHVEPDTPLGLEGEQTTGPSGFPSPNDKVPWGLDSLDSRTPGLDDSYTYSNDGTGVDVYVVDTGVKADHPAFSSVSSGWGYRQNATALNSYQTARSTPNPDSPGHFQIDPCPYSPQNQIYDPANFDAVSVPTDDGTTDNMGHGTHVAGTVGGALTGVSKGVNIIPVRALDSCGRGTSAMIVEALKWVLTDHATGRAVVNMSLGLSSTSASIDAQIADLLAEGVVVVAAAGNSAVTACGTTPAGTPGTISVGASGAQFAEASFSNYGDCVDIFAPGGSLTPEGTAAPGQGIVSAWPKAAGVTNTYVEEWGTSMAAPHVTGAVAQYLQGVASWPPADVSKVPGDAWSWLKKNATCNAISYFNTGRTKQTPNRYLSIATGVSTPCAPRNVKVTQASGSSEVSWDEILTGNGNTITGYRVTTVPVTAGCTATQASVDPGTGRAKCTLAGLSNGTAYTVSVVATYGVADALEGSAAAVVLYAGPGATTTTASTTTLPPVTTTVAPTTTTVAPTTTTTTAPQTTTTTEPPPSTTVPAVTPTAAAPVTAVTSTKSILLSWPAVTSVEAVTYVVSISPGGVSCRTTNTSCNFVGVSIGTVYNFSIVARTASGQSSVALRYTVTAGINQKFSSVARGSRISLSTLVTSLSKGSRKYAVTSGGCRVVSGRLVAPASAGTCKIKVSIARWRTYKAMSAALTFNVT